MGRYNEAIAEIRKAHKIDPLSLVVHRNVGVTYLYARQYDMAIEVLEEVAEINPEFPHLQNFLARSYFYNEMYDKALTAIQTCENDSRIWEGIIYARLGELDNAKQILDQYLLLSKETYVSPVWLALLLFSFDRDEEGFRQLEHDYERHNPGLINIKTYPEFDQFRSDPRYINLLDKMGLPVD